MYDESSLLIVSILFILILLSIEVGNLFGKRYHKKTGEDIKSQTNAIMGGVFGLLALLLGFTFSIALNRFDSRTEAQIEEANAIGTALLRTALLPEPYHIEGDQLLQQYVDVRLELINVDLTKVVERRRLLRKTEKIQDAIWATATAAVEIDPRPVTTGMFITALNKMIDAQEKRNTIQEQHVPEPIFLLLFLVFIAAGALMGYAKGLSKNRSRIPTTIFIFLITLVVFIIIDLDRPKRAIIKVSQASMLDLKNE